MDIASYLLGKSKGGSGTSNYEDLTNKPSINGVPLVGNKTSEDLGIGGNSGVHITNSNKNSSDILEALNIEYQKYQNGEDYYVYGTANVDENELRLRFKYNSASRQLTLVSDYATSAITTAGGFYIFSLVIGYSLTNNVISRNLYYLTRNGVITGLVENTTPSSDNFILSTKNTKAYTPTSQYHPATKGYVDSAIASAITDALGGGY